MCESRARGNPFFFNEVGFQRQLRVVLDYYPGVHWRFNKTGVRILVFEIIKVNLGVNFTK